MVLTAIHTARKQPKQMMKVHEPPKRATTSATRSPMVMRASTRSFTFWICRRERSSSAPRSRWMTTPMKWRAAPGWRSMRAATSRSGTHSSFVGAVARAVAVRLPLSKTASSPKNEPASKEARMMSSPRVGSTTSTAPSSTT